ncbi:MAG TPA: type IX secretion system outer membrane channel protein PorV [Ohtaekwangia sp.]|nr:type IX secretion system outer membrane channel protein PorV [Ohtaekwangia sp.]
MKLRAVPFFILAVVSLKNTYAQTDPSDLLGQDNAITTAVPFLAISPDARHAALGDAGVATSPDANAAYWNAGKLVFIDKKYGGSFSYTPWLGKIINDMSVSYLSGFYKLTREQAIGLAIKYFDLGEISFTDTQGFSLGDFNPREFAFDLTYSRLLTEEFSIGGTGRYIYSNLTGAFSGIDAQAGHSVAVDLGVYYTKQLKKSAHNSTLSFGATITNIGAKISYTNAENEDFLPTNLRLGSAYTTELDPYNTITFTLDFNKLLVPSPPVYDEDGNIAYGKDPDRSILSAMFGSFGDAPNGGSEELKEVMTSAGIEYWYNKTFAGRLGYFNEARTKGNRKYMTLGVGFRKNNFGLDVAYLVPTNKREHPLAETLRFTLLFQIRESSLDLEESVTD